MSQGFLCPNLTKNPKVSQIAKKKFSLTMLLGGLTLIMPNSKISDFSQCRSVPQVYLQCVLPVPEHYWLFIDHNIFSVDITDCQRTTYVALQLFIEHNIFSSFCSHQPCEIYWPWLRFRSTGSSLDLDLLVMA